MGQQPNIELTAAKKPRATPEPPPARRWRPTKPGLIVTPDQVPKGGHFGGAGPDAGWALRLIGRADLPDEDPNLKGVLEGLMMARAASLGRAPIPEDLETALVLCGYGFEAPPEIIERRERWMAAVPHESRPGRTAVAEVPEELLQAKPEQARYAMSRGGATE